MAQEIALLNEQEVSSVFQEAVAELDRYDKTLRGLEPSLLKAGVAMEAAQVAKRYLEAVNNSELKTHVDRLNQEHKRATKWLKKVRMPGELLLQLSNNVRSEWEVERRRQNEQERREREQQANLFAAKQKKAEVEHLREIGREAEADIRAAAPVTAVTVGLDPNAGKPVGEIMVEVWRPKRDETGEIVFTDLVSYFAWLVGQPALYHFVKHQYGKIKKWLSDNHGLVQPPGMVIEHTYEPRTRMEREEE